MGKRRPTKVLIVEKYPVVRAGLRVMLRATDIRVVGEAATPEDALRLVASRKPNIVLAHVRISDWDDIARLARIKEKQPKVSLVILTRNQDPFHASRAIALGCSGYIHERVDAVDLLKALRVIARGEWIVEPALLRELLKEIAQRPDGGRAGAQENLTVPELEVLRLISEGRTNTQIAQRLGYSVGTVKDYVQKIISKLEVSDRTQAAVKAVRLGLLG